MTPKEKALELYGKYWRIVDTLSVKQCALIAVDEILYSVKDNFIYSIKFHQYWKEVKQEIEKL
jgi:hypothetical protein